jgi:hypothetical protein
METYRPARRSNGCLWGCLGVALVLVAPLLLAWGYGAWFFYTGFRESPLMRTAIEMARRDGLAQQALGSGISVTGVSSNMFAFVPGAGARNHYVLQLAGSKGLGSLEVTAHSEGPDSKIDSMILTGPDGRRYDLLRDTALPGKSGTPPAGDTI